MRQLHALALIADIHQPPGPDFALVHAKRGQPAHVGIHIDLEHVPEKVAVRTRRIDLVRCRGLPFTSEEFGGVALERARHELRKHPQQLFQAGAGVGRYEADRNQVTAPEGPFEGIVELFQGDFLAFQVHHHEVVVQFHDLVDDLRMGFLDGGEIGCGIGGLEEAVGHGRAAVGGEVHGQAAPAEGIDDRRQHTLEIRIRRVDLVDDDQPAEIALGGGLHHPLGEQFHARLGADHDRGRLRRGQRPEGAAHEVGISRAVQQVDEAAVVFQVRDSRVQRMPQPFLVIGEIADRRAPVYRARRANGACLLQQGLDQGRLAGPGVSDNGDIAYLFCRVRCSHGGSFSSCGRRNL